jgi:hypothetical protein
MRNQATANPDESCRDRRPNRRGEGTTDVFIRHLTGCTSESAAIVGSGVMVAPAGSGGLG